MQSSMWWTNDDRFTEQGFYRTRFTEHKVYKVYTVHKVLPRLIKCRI